MSLPQRESASSTALPSTKDIELDVQKQRKYFLRCLKTLLPTGYTSNDSNRMSLAFFIVAGLDLLDGLSTSTSEQERSHYIDWIYRNEHPGGGFRAFPGTDLGSLTTAENESWDPANLPATYFALASLIILGDDLQRLDRKNCLQWLPKLQRSDGSFGETWLNGEIHGGYDSRFGYCAAGVRYFLRGRTEGEVAGCRDMDVDKLVQCIRLAEVGTLAADLYHSRHEYG